jgi:hypothetical protein
MRRVCRWEAAFARRVAGLRRLEMRAVRHALWARAWSAAAASCSSLAAFAGINHGPLAYSPLAYGPLAYNPLAYGPLAYAPLAYGLLLLRYFQTQRQLRGRDW